MATLGCRFCVPECPPGVAEAPRRVGLEHLGASYSSRVATSARGTHRLRVASVPATRGRAGSIYVVVDDLDSHHTRARDAGAEVIRELCDTDYGSREYDANDTEGNSWYFGT